MIEGSFSIGFVVGLMAGFAFAAAWFLPDEDDK